MFYVERTSFNVDNRIFLTRKACATCFIKNYKMYECQLSVINQQCIMYKTCQACVQQSAVFVYTVCVNLSQVSAWFNM